MARARFQFSDTVRERLSESFSLRLSQWPVVGVCRCGGWCLDHACRRRYPSFLVSALVGLSVGILVGVPVRRSGADTHN